MRFLMLVLAVVLVLLQARLWLSERRPARGVAARSRGRTRRVEDNGRLATRNSALEAEVLDLKQGLAAAEERARTELGMIHSGETFYQIAPAAPRRRALIAAVRRPRRRRDSRERHIANSPFQRRRVSGARPAHARRAPASLAEVIVVAPDRNRSGAQQLADARDAAARRARRRQPLLRQRHADRLRAHRDHGPARARAARRADLRDQSTAPISATTCCTPAPSPRRWKAGSSVSRRSRCRWC